MRGTVKYAVNGWICAEDVGDRGVALDLEKLRVKYGIGSPAPPAPVAPTPPAPPASSSSSSSSSSESDDDAAPAAATDFEAPD